MSLEGDEFDIVEKVVDGFLYLVELSASMSECGETNGVARENSRL